MDNHTEELWAALEADIRSDYYFSNEQLLRRLAEIKEAGILKDPSGYCCEAMKDQLTYECEYHPDLTCPDIIVTRTTSFRPIGLVEYKVSPRYILWGRNAEYSCRFCPWCGTDLGHQAYEKDVEALLDESGNPEV